MADLEKKFSFYNSDGEETFIIKGTEDEIETINNCPIADTKAREDIEKVSTQIEGIANLFSTEQTTNSYKIKCGNKVIAEIPLGSTTPSQPTVTKYTVINNLTNATNSNSMTEIEENQSYTATITANEGYSISSIVITMGGIDITTTVYNNGNINISSVTGNINIIATATVSTLTENPLTNLIVDIKENDYYLDSSDSLYKIHNNVNDEIVVAYKDQSQLNPFRTFPNGKFANVLTAAGTAFQNLTGAITFIYDEAHSSGKITKLSKIQNYITFVNEYNTTWDNYSSKANEIPYINTNGESVTYTSDKYKKDIILSNEWNRTIMTIVLEEDGKINTYLNNELAATIPAPSDFSRWDYIAMSDEWNELKLYQKNISNMINEGDKINFIVRQGATSLEEIELYHIYSEEQSVTLTNNIASLALEEGDNFF